jgi:glycosyltransferase involved in cell wall biosynthesis
MTDKKSSPSVSCIMPTANRAKYIPFAIDYFLKQDYPNAELVIIDDGKEPIGYLLPDDHRVRYFYSEPIGTVGTKRNYACREAKGDIIMHWDDDDWHASDWISKQVGFLLESGADVCGIEHVHFFSPVTDTFWQGTSLNRNNPNRKSWVNGSTLAYWKSFWALHPFQDRQTGEDDAFLKTPGIKVFAHDYIDGFVALLHPENTTVKYFENFRHKRSTQTS